jgi:hypothetical protein
LDLDPCLVHANLDALQHRLARIAAEKDKVDAYAGGGVYKCIAEA